MTLIEELAIFRKFNGGNKIPELKGGRVSYINHHSRRILRNNQGVAKAKLIKYLIKCEKEGIDYTEGVELVDITVK